MPGEWTAERVGEIARAYQPAAVLMAAAELELFDRLAGGPFTAKEAAEKLAADPRGVTVLLDALAAVGLLDKSSDHYSIPPAVAECLTSRGKHSTLAMMQHQANCMRSWAQLAKVVKAGTPAERQASIRGKDADYQAFIEAMDNASRPMAAKVIGGVALPPFKHVLDVGGASGTWTITLLSAQPQATATIFDLPHVIPHAQQRIAAAGFSERVDFVAGDFYVDPLPGPTQLAWISAIVHQNSRQQNRELFTSAFRALEPGGHVLIRDMVMDESRTAPPAGAMFAINMLVNTPGGGTFTLEELRQDLQYAGLADVKLIRRDEAMNSVVQAMKPA